MSRKMSVRPRLEGLETRLTPTATVSTNGNLYIDASDGNDVVSVKEVTINEIAYYEVTENTEVTRIKVADITGQFVYFFGNDGNDTFVNETKLFAIAYGGEGDDILTSYSGGYLDGEGGNDTLTVGPAKTENVLIGGEGNDILKGSSGRDLIYGDDGNDVIDAGAGNDYIEGGVGNDEIKAGDGNDVVFGGDGVDIIWGGNGNDQLHGGNGRDTIYGGNGNDTMWGGDDATTNLFYGGQGNDTIIGSRGADTMHGEAGNDKLIGGDGDDRLFGGAGSDYLWGQNGNDQLDGGNDKVADYLDGGAGRNRYRREMYYNGVAWVNRERIPIFRTGIDVVYA